MTNDQTLNGNKTQNLFTPDVQYNMKITGTSNPEILRGIKNGNYSVYAETSGKDFLLLDLQDEYFVKGVRLCLWHYDDRYYTYECWVSKDNENWKEIFSGFQAKCNDTIIIMDSIRYIRFKGTNTKTDYLQFVNFKIY